ncbi:MAG: hypothetical protein KDB14_17100 [Planctomycetales bacterium]|nr:hypothetical protein [Planctomycetales bacterium]
MKLSGDTIKQFFVEHVEKIGFGVAMALVGLFVYSGLQLEGYKNTPSELKDLAAAASQRVASFKWDEKLEQEELDPKRVFSEEVKASSLPVDPTGYSATKPLNPILDVPIVKRGDPEILPPRDLEVQVAFGPLAIIGATNPIADLEPAPKPEPKVIRKRAPRKRRPRNRGGAEGMSSDMGMGMEDSMMMEDESDAAADSMSMGMGAGMEGMTGSQPAGPRARRFPNAPKYWLSTNANAPMSSSAPTNVSNRGVEGRLVVCVTAPVPFQEQYDAFEREFKDSIDYRPSRDEPKYLSFIVQRSEVGDDPNDLNWQTISNLVMAQQEYRKYAMRGREVIDPLYAMGNVLTMEMPPLLLTDTDYKIGGHSQIPLKRDKPASKAKSDGAHGAIEDPATPGNPLIPTNPRGGSGMSSDGMGMSSDGMGMSSDGMGMSSDGMGMSSDGMGMGMDGGSGGGPRVPMTEFKLLRYFDTTAQPGKKYRYRFQLLLEDPNNPRMGGPLNDRILKAEVLERLKEVTAQEQANNYKIFYRFSPWSDPSPVVEMPSIGEVYAGPGMEIVRSKHSPPTKTGGVINFIRPVAKLAAVIWGGRQVPTRVSYTANEATYGTVLNTKSDLKIIDPLTLELKLAKDFPFRSDNVVVDLEGANSLTPNERENPQLAPMAFAITDAAGNLIVRDEVEDAEQFHIFSFVDDEPPPVVEQSGGAAGGAPGMQMGDGMGLDFGAGS